MAAPIRQSVCKILKTSVLKNPCHFDRSLQRNISFFNTSSKHSSFKLFTTKHAKVLAGIVGVSSVFATKAVWNAVSAESPAVDNAPSLNVKGLADTRGLKLTLYQFQSCPFCCKVRAALDYYGFSYNVVEVNSVTKKQLKFSQYKKVPVLVCEGENGDKLVSMNDSSVIVSILVSYLFDPSVDLATLKTYYPALEETVKMRKKWEFPNRYFIMYGDSIADARTEKQRNDITDSTIREERRWREWVDDHLVHMISPNVYRTPSESLEAFHHFSDWGQWDKNFSSLQRLLVIYVGAPVMYIIGKVVKKRHNLNDDVRISLYEACDEWMKALGKRKYLGGDEPCIADLSVYGVLSSFEGCQAFKDLMENSKINNWYRMIQQDIQEHKGALKTQSSVK